MADCGHRFYLLDVRFAYRCFDCGVVIDCLDIEQYRNSGFQFGTVLTTHHFIPQSAQAHAKQHQTVTV